MMWLKGCPRCQGDLFEELGIGPGAIGSRFVTCLQCGYTLTAEQEALLPRPERRTPSSAAWRRAILAVAGQTEVTEAAT
jgi:hypothetical protein